MTAGSSPIKVLLGRFISKKKIELPLDLSQENLRRFIDNFSSQEKIELYCLAEFRLEPTQHKDGT